MNIRKEIQEAAHQLEAALAAHDDERGDSWKDEGVGYLLARLDGEVGELKEAIDGADMDAAAQEAIDVTAFGVFLYWRLTHPGEGR